MKKTTFFAVLAVFFLPVFIAVALNSSWLNWHSSRTKNHGELIQPPMELPGFSIDTVSGATVGRDDLKDRWQLLHYQPQACDKDCMDALYWMRQVRRAQDRHQPDIGLVMATPGAVDASAAEKIMQLAPDYRVFAGAAGATLAESLPDSDRAASYIIDPRGYIILRYPHDADFNGMRRDLARLLTWTKPGPDSG